MKIETFELERFQSLWENTVKYNLTDSGVHPFSINELLNKDEIEKLLSLTIGYGQTNGSIELRDTISKLYHEADIDNILVTNGTAEANFISMWTMIEPGDEILIMLPNYLQIWGIVRSFGAKVKPYHLKEEHDWKPDFDEINQLVSSKTKMIVICNPNNPTGAVLSDEDMKEFINIAEKNDTWIFTDEIYRGSELNGKETESFWNSYDKVIVTCGLAKSYALQGLRIGWMTGPKKIIEKGWAYHDYTTIASNIISNYIAALALKPELRQKILNRNRSWLNENLAYLTDWLKSHKDLFKLTPPKAGGMAFIHYNMNINSTDLANKLREEKSVLIVPGDQFGMDHFIRLGIGTEKECFLSGLDLMEETLKEIL